MELKRWLPVATAVAVATISLAPSRSLAQSLTLDPASAGLGAATAADVLTPAPGFPAPGPLPPPVLGNTAAALGLLPGDVINAISYGDDSGFAGSLQFSVDRGSVSAGPTPVPPDVFTEVMGVPVGFQGEAAGDLFVAFDPSCPPTPHTQMIDGDGVPIGPLACYGGFGTGLTEVLAAPPPPFIDNLNAFDWGAPGELYLSCMGFTLAPGSPTLTPGTNPLLPAGAQPGDILFTCPGPPVFVGIAFPAAAHALIVGPPGCAPPACDAIDALSLSFGSGVIFFSLTPGSPTLTGFGLSAADVFGGPIGFGGAPPAPLVVPAAGLGLVAGDNIDGLEATANGCPVAVGAGPDAGDLDGIGACDNCPGTFNPSQDDSDFDGIGDACDPCTDTDADGFGNPGFPANICATDLCPFTPGPNGDGDGDGVGDVCDNCPLVANANQANADFDADGDVCDLCPNVSAGAPAAFNAGTLKKAQLLYKNNGPGSGDDSAKSGASFTTGAAFDPDSTDTVYMTLVNTTTGAILSSTTMTAGASWTQPNPAKLSWKYATTVAPLVKAKIKEAPAASMIYKWKASVKSATLPGPQIAPATDDIRVVFEITPAGLCFDGTLTTCASTPLKKDGCKP